MNNYKPNEYEQEIDLIDLFWKLLEKWKMIIALAIILAILLGVGTYTKDSMKNQTELNALASSSVDTNVEHLCGITASERRFTEILVGKAKEGLEDVEEMSNINTMIKALSTNQKDYYNILFENGDIEVAKQEIVSNAIANTKANLSAKYVLLGFVLGGFIGCAIVGVKYIFSNRLLNTDEMKNRFGGMIFGALVVKNMSNRKKTIPTTEEQLENIATRIELYCKQNEITKVALLSSDISAMNDEYVKTITDKVIASGVEVVNLGNIHEKSDALRSCIEIGKAIVLEGVGISKYKEIENLIVTANEYKVDLLGSVVL